MEWYVLVATALPIVHLVAFLDLDAVHLDGTARLGGHHNLIGHQLAKKGQQGRPVELRTQSILSPHKQTTEPAGRGSIGTCHRVNPI